MDTKEKLEQAVVVKEKGTVYFKVCVSILAMLRLKNLSPVDKPSVVDLLRESRLLNIHLCVYLSMIIQLS